MLFARCFPQLSILAVSVAVLFGCSERTTEPTGASGVPQTNAIPIVQPIPHCDRLQDLLASATTLKAQGYIPQSTYNQIVRNAAQLCTNDQYFHDFVTAVSFRWTMFFIDGGIVSGGEWTVENVFGGDVGSGQIHVTYENGNITGVTASGGVLLGEVEAEQVGSTWTKECPDGSTVECGAYQLVWTQEYAWIIENVLKSDPEELCAPCPTES